MRLKHILVTLLMGFVIVFTTPIFALAEESDQFEDAIPTNENADSTKQSVEIVDPDTDMEIDEEDVEGSNHDSYNEDSLDSTEIEIDNEINPNEEVDSSENSNVVENASNIDSESDIKQHKPDSRDEKITPLNKNTNDYKNIVNGDLRNGLTDKEVIELKQNLSKLGFGGMNINKTYGDFTVTRVKKFQNYYGLEPDGRVTNKLLNTIRDILGTPFQTGRKDKRIIQLKEKLIELGYGGMNLNETYGSFTAKRVKELQEDNNLHVHGIVDFITKTKIEELLAKPIKTGERMKRVITFKKKLVKLGFGGMNINELYGSFTAKRVKQFQEYYGLDANGVADQLTFSKVDMILSTPFQVSQKHPDVITIKKDLTKLGFGGMNLNETYGNFTATRVKQLQKYYGLIQNGILDEPTLRKINDTLSSPYLLNKKHEDIITLKEKLISLKFGGMNLNETYGNFTITRVKQLQKYYGLVQNGIADEPTLNKINDVLSSPFQLNNRHKDIIAIKKLLAKSGYGGMNINDLYGSFTEKQVKRFQKKYKLKDHGIVDDVTLRKLNTIANRVIKIFIDAGHGGHDSGAVSNNVLEKNLTLSIAKKIQSQLGKYANIQLKMSRTSDKYLTLAERTKMANDWGADLFISVHINAGGGTGLESFIHSSMKKDEISIQNTIHDHLISGLKKDNIIDRGKKNANFHVLRESKMNSILFEYLFIDTKKDRDKLTNNSFQNKIARLTAEGISKALKLKKK